MKRERDRKKERDRGREKDTEKQRARDKQSDNWSETNSNKCLAFLDWSGGPEKNPVLFDYKKKSARNKNCENFGGKKISGVA